MPIPTLPKTAVKVDNFSGQFSKNSKKPKRKNHQQAKKSQKKPKSWSSNTDQNDSLDYKNQGFPKQFSKISDSHYKKGQNNQTSQTSNSFQQKNLSIVGGQTQALVQRISNQLSGQISQLSSQFKQFPKVLKTVPENTNTPKTGQYTTSQNAQNSPSNFRKLVANKIDEIKENGQSVSQSSSPNNKPNQDFFKRNQNAFDPNSFQQSPNYPNSNFSNSSFPNLNYSSKNDFNSPAIFEGKKNTRDAKSVTISRQFALRHTYRAGAIVWVKYRGENYYVVFRSLSRPSRGVQIPGGRIERMENVAEAVTREVYEEIGVQTRILCPLGFLFTENLSDNFSRIEIYYIVRPIFPIDVFRHWQHKDLDEKRQTPDKQQILDCWCVPCERDVNFLSYEQGKAVLMFRQWLGQHKKPGDGFKNN
jgi:8-oxo-dGTP pyrophosphatase MutT (NUDIX family)